MEDTGRVLARFYDAIEYRGFDQTTAEGLGKYGVPVWNGLTNQHHPTQALADLLTMSEHSMKPFDEIRLCYIGDGGNNVADSLLVAAAKMGLDFRIAAPDELQPDRALLGRCEEAARETRGRLLVTSDIATAVRDVDFLYTDIWLSMGTPEADWAGRIARLAPYQVNADLMALTGNSAVKFMHCLPAFHDRNTEIGEAIFQKLGLEAMEVTDDVFESEASIVFDQAENRMHAIKAIMVATLAD